MRPGPQHVQVRCQAAQAIQADGALVRSHLRPSLGLQSVNGQTHAPLDCKTPLKISKLKADKARPAKWAGKAMPMAGCAKVPTVQLTQYSVQAKAL
jgi:hypothetical protein